MSQHDDTRTAEEFRRQLLEETLRSLIRDPSRWTWDSAGEDAGTHGRTRPRAITDSSNRCPGWMCAARLEAPCPTGRYCSYDCRRRTLYARKVFRRDLERLRSGTAHPCMECGRLMFRRTDAKACSTRCYQRKYQRERQRDLRAAARERRQAATVATA